MSTAVALSLVGALLVIGALLMVGVLAPYCWRHRAPCGLCGAPLGNTRGCPECEDFMDEIRSW